MSRALLIGKEPGMELGYSYVAEAPYEAVVIGSLTLAQLLRFREEAVLTALAEGKPVYLYTPGLPEAPKNRALAGSLTAAQRELKNWGVLFTDGGRKKLVTAEEARLLRSTGYLYNTPYRVQVVHVVLPRIKICVHRESSPQVELRAVYHINHRENRRYGSLTGGECHQPRV